jgi:hypothetical protein
MQCLECPPPRIRDHDAANFDRLVARFNRLTLDCCEPALEEAAQHVRCDPVCEQERLRDAALTAGKQLKRLAPLRAKTTPSRGHRHFWAFIDYPRRRDPCAALIAARGPHASRVGHLAFPGPKRGPRTNIVRVLQRGHDRLLPGSSVSRGGPATSWLPQLSASAIPSAMGASTAAPRCSGR